MDVRTGIYIGAAFLYLIQLVIPGVILFGLALLRPPTRTHVLISVFLAWTYGFYIFYAGQWGLVPFGLRYLLLLFLAGLTIRNFALLGRKDRWWPRGFWSWSGLLVLAAPCVLFVGIDIRLYQGFSTEEHGLQLDYPLEQGFVGHGGNSELINYHQQDPGAQHYALDISRLNILGLRAQGVYPERLEDYEVFGESVLSPCNCLVVEVRSDLQDLPPGTMDRERITGNYIVLEHEGNLIFLGHLKKNSIIVQEGQMLEAGQPIAQVGNTGNTTEPHLHIHAVQGTDTGQILTGQGVPLFFNGRFLKRNDRFRAGSSWNGEIEGH